MYVLGLCYNSEFVHRVMSVLHCTNFGALKLLMDAWLAILC